jgi:hypothetical protein
MGWKGRFRKILRIADEKQRMKMNLIKQDRRSNENVVNERRKKVRALAPRMEKVAKQFKSAVKGEMKAYKPEYWRKGNIAWHLETAFGGIEIQTWPWLMEISKPRLLRGIWLQYIGPYGEELVSESKVKGIKLDRYYELGREGALLSGYYYWIQANFHTGPCVFGYFISLQDFSEERLASVLEEIGYDLVKRFTTADFYTIGRTSSRF